MSMRYTETPKRHWKQFNSTRLFFSYQLEQQITIFFNDTTFEMHSEHKYKRGAAIVLSDIQPFHIMTNWQVSRLIVKVHFLERIVFFIPDQTHVENKNYILRLYDGPSVYVEDFLIWQSSAQNVSNDCIESKAFLASIKYSTTSLADADCGCTIN